MKICLAFFPIMDMGGLTNNNNNLCAGLQALGHQTDTLLFMPREKLPRNGVSGGKGTRCPYSGMEHDQMRGYTWPLERCVAYRGSALKGALEILNSFDLIIWQIPCPTMKEENFGNMDWVELYRQTTVPQVAYIHDGNMVDSYPWMSLITPYLKGVGCVNHAALNSCQQLDIGYSLTPSPQPPFEMPDITYGTFKERLKGFISLQTFKAWKHVPELVAAMPYADVEVKMLAGRGIDYCYLTSEKKNKWPGVWDAALLYDMSYLGVITNEDRDKALKNVVCLVDPSWSKKYAKIGDHYNRVAVEAIMMGAVPIVRPLGISTNPEGHGEVFRADYNCLVIPQNVTPEKYGWYLTSYCNMEYEQYYKLIKNGLEMMPMWDRKYVAQQFLDLADGTHYYHGHLSPAVERGTADAVRYFFGARYA